MKREKWNWHRLPGADRVIIVAAIAVAAASMCFLALAAQKNRRGLDSTLGVLKLSDPTSQVSRLAAHTDEWKPFKGGEVQSGDLFASSDTQGAQLVFENGNQIELRPGTSILLEKVDAATEVRVLEGKASVVGLKLNEARGFTLAPLPMRAAPQLAFPQVLPLPKTPR